MEPARKTAYMRQASQNQRDLRQELAEAKPGAPSQNRKSVSLSAFPKLTGPKRIDLLTFWYSHSCPLVEVPKGPFTSRSFGQVRKTTRNRADQTRHSTQRAAFSGTSTQSQGTPEMFPTYRTLLVVFPMGGSETMDVLPISVAIFFWGGSPKRGWWT